MTLKYDKNTKLIGGFSIDIVDETYNRDTQEMYFDWYVKQRQEILNLKSEVTK